MNRVLFDIINEQILEALSNTHTILVARIEKVSAKTIDARPVVNRKVKGESITLPVFVEIPPVFMQGGTSHTTYPLSVGDYCLLLVSERCFDRWYSGQDFKTPPEYRMHDYSDCFAIVGVNPLGTALTIPSVITRIGDTYQEGNIERIGDVVQEGNFDLTGNLTVIGDINLTGNFTMTGTMLVNGIDIGTHFHSQPSDGGGDSEANTNGPQS